MQGAEQSKADSRLPQYSTTTLSTGSIFLSNVASCRRRAGYSNADWLRGGGGQSNSQRCRSDHLSSWLSGTSGNCACAVPSWAGHSHFYCHFFCATDIYRRGKSALFLWAARKNTRGSQHCQAASRFFFVKAQLNKLKLKVDWLPCTAAHSFAFLVNQPQCVITIVDNFTF